MDTQKKEKNPIQIPFLCLSLAIFIAVFFVLQLIFTFILSKINHYENFYSVFYYASYLLAGLLLAVLAKHTKEAAFLHVILLSLLSVLVLFGIGILLGGNQFDFKSFAIGAVILVGSACLFLFLLGLLKQKKKKGNSKFKFR